MCGICGFTGKPDAKLIRAMTTIMTHRGPDEEGFYTGENISLGVRRLSIIDPETGHQPVHNEDKNVWAVFNGEIYNFRELRDELGKRGHRFYTDHSDTEVIVHLYEEYGADFCDRLNGMFAIAVWDNRSGLLMLFRDRMGQKPLFYTVINGDLVFGSEIKTILAVPGYRREMDFDSVYHYFSLKNIPAPMTAFKGISSMLPGEMLVFKDGRFSCKRWWKIRFDEKEPSDEDHIADKLVSLLRRAVELRMRSDVPFGAYLSGGIDSSIIVALMSEFTDKPVKTFTLGYEDDFKNKEADVYCARRISKIYGTEHHEHVISHADVAGRIADVIRSFDQPFSGTISTFFLTEFIRSHVKVALSGDGSDELFGSYLSHRTALPMYHYASMIGGIADRGLSEEEKGLLGLCDEEYIRGLYEKSRGSDRAWRYYLYLATDDEKRVFLTDRYKSEMGDTETLVYVNRAFDQLTSKDPLNRILEMEWNTQFPDQVLAFVDFLSMAHSVEIRSPFLDHSIAEFAATIPGRLKIKGSAVKYILKKAVSGILPAEIVNRAKEGFVLPVYCWLPDKLRDFVKETLSETSLKKHGFFNIEVVRDILEKYFAGNSVYAGRIWNMMMFQLWWEKYFS